MLARCASRGLLHRNVAGAGYYEFAHKSLAEYFVAFKFATEIDCIDPAFSQTYCEANGQHCSLPFQQKDFSNLVESFGAEAFTDEKMYAVRQFLREMIAKRKKERLWQIISHTKGKTSEQVRYVGGNAATLLRNMGVRFENANLAHTILAGADLSGLELSKADLTGCDLYEADLSGSVFNEGTFKSAKLQNTTFSIACMMSPSEIPVKESKPHEIHGYYAFKVEKVLSSINIVNYSSHSRYHHDEKWIAIVTEIQISDLSQLQSIREELLKVDEIIFLAFYDNEIEEFEQRYPGRLPSIYSVHHTTRRSKP